METRTRSIALTDIAVRAGTEEYRVFSGTLWIFQDYIDVGVPGMRRWEVHLHEPPLSLAVSRAEYITFEANGYSGKGIWVADGLKGSRPLIGA